MENTHLLYIHILVSHCKTHTHCIRRLVFHWKTHTVNTQASVSLTAKHTITVHKQTRVSLQTHLHWYSPGSISLRTHLLYTHKLEVPLQSTHSSVSYKTLKTQMCTAIAFPWKSFVWLEISELSSSSFSTLFFFSLAESVESSWNIPLSSIDWQRRRMALYDRLIMSTLTSEFRKLCWTGAIPGTCECACACVHACLCVCISEWSLVA